MSRVGIITFHASYNFGTVMQAWATQQMVKKYGYDCEIINFRMKSQKDKYSLFPLHNGFKYILRNLIQIKFIGLKYKSNKKYEKFICNQLSITEEYNTLEQLSNVGKYDIYLAGSDQIWGYSIPEFVSAKADVRGVYYLNFIEGYKISYASSTGAATYEELLPYKKYMDLFAHIAVREERGKEVISKITGKRVEMVLDPTFLITHDEWVKIIKKQKKIYDEKYVLIYSLQGRKKARKWRKIIRFIQANKNLKFVTVVPFSPITGEGIYNRADAGPEELLNLFANADYIYTDTFHGMSFSIHYRKPFTLYEDTEADCRKRNILAMFGLEDRETNLLENSIEMFENRFNYSDKEELLSKEIDHSSKYLIKALAGFTE